jgi:hypothetical protein
MNSPAGKIAGRPMRAANRIVSRRAAKVSNAPPRLQRARHAKLRAALSNQLSACGLAWRIGLARAD